MTPSLRLVPGDSGSFLAAAGLPAQQEQWLGWVLLAGGLLASAIVAAVLVLALRGRARRVGAKTWLVVGGLVVPGLVLAALQAVNLRDLGPRGAGPGTPLLIGISARLWWWEVRVFPDDGGAPVVLANELRLPVGRPVRLALSTDEVIHSLWLPPLAGKLDLLPGRVMHLSLQATRPGRFRGVCAEFCGSGHAAMALPVVAEPAADFARWLAAQRAEATAPATPLQRDGRARFEQLRCNACHRVRGHFEPLLPGGRGGPDLTHLASRPVLGAGVLPNDEAGLRAWITGVQQLKPSAQMPAYPDLDAATLDALVAWLASLR